jgi:hypothetical protein
MSLDTVRARARLTLPNEIVPALRKTRSPITMLPVSSIVVLGATICRLRAASAVTSLNVEPGA